MRKDEVAVMVRDWDSRCLSDASPMPDDGGCHDCLVLFVFDGSSKKHDIASGSVSVHSSRSVVFDRQRLARVALVLGAYGVLCSVL